MAVFNFLQFDKGMISNVSPLLLPENALYHMSNINHVYSPGYLLKRPGYVNIGSAIQANKAITGLYNFRQSASVQKMLATCNDSTDDDTQLFYSTGAGWTEIAAAETDWANKASIDVEMESFIGYCFFVGYGTTDGFLPPRSLTNTTFGTTNTTSMPNAKFIKRYRDRLYIGNTDISGTATPFRVYFSSVPSAGTITWTVASDFFDVDFSEEITGMGENWDYLQVFTEYSTFLWNQDSKRKIWDIGCSSHRTIKNYNSYTLWANKDGVWRSNGGSTPELISHPVDDFIR